VPHPGIGERAFVLLPLAEIAPNLAIPGHGAVAALAARFVRAGIERLDRDD
jgi:2-amino-4-hydroxy-6-hydroxymethyldihydropteridine diphosphokinase